MAALSSFDDLVAFLARENVPHDIDREAQVVELPTNEASLPGRLYLRWEKHVPFINMVQFVAIDVPVARIAELERAIARLNNKLDVPGFGLDDANRRLYNRTCIPVPAGIEPALLNQLGLGCITQAKQFAPAFRAVIDGKPGADILAIADAVLAGR